MYYKVVSKTGCDKLQSAVTKESACVTYSLNKWIGSIIPHSKLFVFTSLETAMALVDYHMAINGYIHIYECQVKNPHKIKTIVSCDYSKKTFEKFWTTKHNKQKIDDKRFWITEPLTGTVVVDAVKLTKLVKVF